MCMYWNIFMINKCDLPKQKRKEFGTYGWRHWEERERGGGGSQ